MTRKGRVRLRRLADALAGSHPELEDPKRAIAEGWIVVDRRVITNPSSLVRQGASIAVRDGAAVLRGERKLRAALDDFGIDVRGRVALDLGAAAGGFTRVLLGAGASRVYAVDAGYGQLLGSLRQDPRVVNLERTNLAALSHKVVPDCVDVVTADLSYVPLARAVPQLDDRVRIASDADLIALVKPQFELGLAKPPGSEAELVEASRLARAGIERAGWSVRRCERSPVPGSRGSIELLLHARRA